MSYTIENYDETFNDYKDILTFMRDLLPRCPIAQKYKNRRFFELICLKHSFKQNH